MIALLLLACSDPAPTAPPSEPSEPAPIRRVVIDPAIAQIVHRLDPDSLIGVDDAGVELPALKGLPSVGFSRQISAEGVLSVGPTQVITTERAGPSEALQQIQSAGVEVIQLPHERTLKGVKALIKAVGETIDADPKPLLAELETSCSAFAKPDPAPRAIFVYARGGGVMNVSGYHTAAHAMMLIAGFENAMAYEGYKPLTPEAAVAADPEYVVFTTRGLESSGGVEGVKQVPGLSLLPAVKEGRILAVDDLQLLALGLDTCTAAASLAAQASK